MYLYAFLLESMDCIIDSVGSINSNNEGDENDDDDDDDVVGSEDGVKGVVVLGVVNEEEA